MLLLIIVSSTYTVQKFSFNPNLIWKSEVFKWLEKFDIFLDLVNVFTFTGFLIIVPLWIFNIIYWVKLKNKRLLYFTYEEIIDFNTEEFNIDFLKMNIKMTRKKVSATVQQTLEKLKRVPKILPRKLSILDVVFCCIVYSVVYTDEHFESDEIQFLFMMKNFIEILKIDFGFSEEEIKKAYYRFMKNDNNIKTTN
ncbi:hypothetical protein [Mycoplasma sp. HS2188]|nr:hypothetical protein [Mycoplasma sp. HS2188]MCT4469764.1 hypothetical protein [Mycoplasma sp. HS2188]